VKNELQENEDLFYWEDKSGRKCIKLVFDINDRRIKGINVFGMRLNHDVCETWIKNKTDVETVINELQTANFDPEFSTKFETEIASDFKTQII